MKRGINVGYQRRGGGQQQDGTTTALALALALALAGTKPSVSVRIHQARLGTKKRGRDWSLISRQKQQRLAKSHGTAL
jgi:hypothetical protein